MANLPRIVIDRLAGGVENKNHPDANLLSAFVERELADGDRMQVLTHLAQCSECREVVALALPEAATAEEVFRPAFAHTVSWPVLRWGAAIACVVVVGAAVTLHQRKVVDQTHSGEGTAVVSAPAAQTALGTSALAVVSKPAPAEPAGIQTNWPTQKDHLSGGVAGSIPIPGRAKDDFTNLQSNGAGQTADGSAMSQALGPLSTGSGVPRWALTADGSLQRSFDMGRTWEPVTVSVETSLRAVSTGGFEIWVGGTNGALYHSDDAGDHWLKIQPMAEGQPLTSDIIGVEFPDIEDGRLKTASGEVWTTQDGGSTWRVRATKPLENASIH
jgi:hypothetical protein